MNFNWLFNFFKNKKNKKNKAFGIVDSDSEKDAILSILNLRTTELINAVNEKRKVEKKFTSSYNLLNTLIESIPTPLYYKDRNGIYMGCNSKFAEFFDKTKEQVIGKTLADIGPSTEHANLFKDTDVELMNSNDKFSRFKANIEFRDGTIHTIIFHKNCFYDETGSVNGIVGLLIDITDPESLFNLSNEKMTFVK
jgi:PAS domain S-box-containing protein